MVFMKNNKGYTLVELIITLAVIGIMIVPIYDAFTNANRVNLRAKRQISAAYLAQNEMESIKGMTVNDFMTAFDHLDGTHSYDDVNFDATWNKNITNAETEFTVDVNVQNIALDISPSAVISHVGNTRDWNVKVTVAENSTDGLAEGKGTATKYAITDSNKNLDLVFTNNGSNNVLRVEGASYDIEFIENTKILVDIVGYEGLTDNWIFNIVNNSGIDIDVKRFSDEFNNIKVTPDLNSTTDIYIGNALPIQTVTASTVEEWFRVTVTITHNGTVYETIQSTVGK